MKRLVLPLVMLAGCIGSGTEVGNPNQKPTVGITAFSSRTSLTALPGGDLPGPKGETEDGDDQAGPVDIDSAWISVGGVTAFPSADCQGQGVEDPALAGQVADLATGPLVRESGLPDGDYCRLQVRLVPAASGTPGIGAASILITGQSPGKKPFQVTSSSVFQLTLSGKSMSFTVGDGQAPVLIAFDVSRWFEDVDLDEAEATGGTVLIDADHNTGALRDFEEKVRESSGLYRDHDHDGRVGPGERNPIDD